MVKRWAAPQSDLATTCAVMWGTGQLCGPWEFQECFMKLSLKNRISNYL